MNWGLVMKPCPFCGCEDTQIVSSKIGEIVKEKPVPSIYSSLISYSWLYSGYCPCCGTLGPAYPTREEAFREWNNRR